MRTCWGDSLSMKVMKFYHCCTSMWVLYPAGPLGCRPPWQTHSHEAYFNNLWSVFEVNMVHEVRWLLTPGPSCVTFTGSKRWLSLIVLGWEVKAICLVWLNSLVCALFGSGYMQEVFHRTGFLCNLEKIEAGLSLDWVWGLRWASSAPRAGLHTPWAAWSWCHLGLSLSLLDIWYSYLCTMPKYDCPPHQSPAGLHSHCSDRLYMYVITLREHDCIFTRFVALFGDFLLKYSMLIFVDLLIMQYGDFCGESRTWGRHSSTGDRAHTPKQGSTLPCMEGVTLSPAP